MQDCIYSRYVNVLRTMAWREINFLNNGHTKSPTGAIFVPITSVVSFQRLMIMKQTTLLSENYSLLLTLRELIDCSAIKKMKSQLKKNEGCNPILRKPANFQTVRDR